MEALQIKNNKPYNNKNLENVVFQKILNNKQKEIL